MKARPARWVSLIAVTALSALLGGCHGARFSLPSLCPLSSYPGGPTVDVGAVAPPPRKLYVGPPTPVVRLRIRGLLRVEPEFLALVDRDVGRWVRVRYVRVRENDALPFEVLRSCRNRWVVIEGDYQSSPMLGEGEIVPERVWLR